MADRANVDDLTAYNRVNARLLPASSTAPLKNIPVRFYLPSSPSSVTSKPRDDDDASGHLKIVQSPIAPMIPGGRDVQTLGTALHAVLPSLFPSRRTPILAKPVLHGAVVPMACPLEELLRSCAYADGWLHVGIEMLG